VKPIRTRRHSTAQRAAAVAACLGFLALCLLAAHVFAPCAALQIAALWLIGGGLLAAWAAVLAWRLPVLRRNRLIGLAVLWAVGIGLAVLLVLLSVAPSRDLLWARSVQWVALTLSTAVGAIFLRALLRVRATPVAGRLLSVISPVAILVLTVVLTLIRT